MDLSVKESDVSVRAKLHNRVASYRAELHRLAKEFARAKCTVNIDLGGCFERCVPTACQGLSALCAFRV